MVNEKTILDPYDMDDEYFFNRYYNNATAFLTERTELFYDGVNYKKLKPYPKQEFVLNNTDDNLLTIVIKCRQVGISTCISGKFAHGAFFGKQERYLFLSSSMVQAMEIMSKFYKTLETIDCEKFKPSFVRKSRSSCKLSNGVEVISLPSGNPSSCRGFTGSLFLDEFGTFDERRIGIDEEIWAAITPSIFSKSGLSMFVAGTPGRKGNVFHKLCTQSLEEITGMNSKDLIYTDSNGETKHIEKNIIWIRHTDVPHIRDRFALICANLTETARKREMLLEFVDDSNEMVFTTDFLRKYAYPEFEELIPLDLNSIINNDNTGILYY